MIEIVFSDSACGSLKMAQHYGESEYIGGCMGVCVTKTDGSQPTSEEIADALKQAQEREQMKWENSMPMGGNPEDIFGFHLMLSVGDISAVDFINKRQKEIENLWSIYPNCPEEEPLDIAQEIHDKMTEIQKRITQHEGLRLWYSNQPDELCGLYWFLCELEQFNEKPEKIYLVKLPEYECRENNTVVTYNNWGEIAPGEWYRYLPDAKIANEAFCRHCAFRWEALQSENAPLRAMLNGELHGVSESFYDEFIYREIAQQEDEFQEAFLIGKVLGKYQLGIGDAWLAKRIEKLIADGVVCVVSKPIEGSPTYHRKLRKANSNAIIKG